MGKIHRKNQIWLYQKFKQDQAEQNAEKVSIKVAEKKEESKSQEKLYMLLDIAKYGIPILIAIIGILLML